jgi:triacylglycerol lipase
MNPILPALSILLMSSSLWASETCKTTYPIVLAHGLFGYGGSIGFLSYWGELPTTLRKCGATVYLAHVSQANMTTERGEQLHRQLLEWGHEKYNLIGHSHGGLDARYVLENYPEIVASVSTIGTPHRGSKVADQVHANLSGNGFLETTSAFFANFLAYSIALLSGHFNWQDARQALHSLTTDALKHFNSHYHIGLSPHECEGGPATYRGRKLYSWGSYGTEPTSHLDWFGYIMQHASRAFPAGEPNDGLVSVCSMKFGKWLGAMPNAHHLIPVGGVVSPVPDGLLGWPEEMFLAHGRRLKGDGV